MSFQTIDRSGVDQDHALSVNFQLIFLAFEARISASRRSRQLHRPPSTRPVSGTLAPHQVPFLLLIFAMRTFARS
jgi:hypothetical protein